MTISALRYHIDSPGNIPRGTNGFFNYGKVAFIWVLDGVRCTGATHWIEHEDGVVYPEALDPVSFVTVLKTGVKVSWHPYGPPIDWKKDIEIGELIGNLANFSQAALKALPGEATAIPLIAP